MQNKQVEWFCKANGYFNINTIIFFMHPSKWIAIRNFILGIYLICKDPVVDHSFEN